MNDIVLRYVSSLSVAESIYISPWLYTVFINDLLNELCASPYSLVIHGVNVTCPTQADDITLMSLCKRGLDSLMDICYTYSCKWRFKYNASKSVVIVFNESKSSFSKRTRSWNLGNEVVYESADTKHVGIFLNKFKPGCPDVNEIVNKLRGQCFALLNCNIFGTGINPLTGAKLYKSIVMPRTLFGFHYLKLNGVALKQCITCVENLFRIFRDVQDQISSSVC